MKAIPPRLRPGFLNQPLRICREMVVVLALVDHLVAMALPEVPGGIFPGDQVAALGFEKM